MRLLALLFLLVCVTSATALPPAAPSGFTAVIKDDLNVDFTWQDNSTDETGFEILFRLDGVGTFSRFLTVAPNTISVSESISSPYPECRAVQWTIRAFTTSAPPLPVTEMSPNANLVDTTLPPRFTSTPFIVAQFGVPFNLAITSICSSGALRESGSANSLPLGLTFDPATGIISGTPTGPPGRYRVPLTAVHAGRTVIGSLLIVLYEDLPPPIAPIITRSLPVLTLPIADTDITIPLATTFTDPDNATTGTRITTNVGTFNIIYLPQQAPLTVANFKGYVSRGDFLESIIHRSVPGFILQGGGYKAAASAPSIPRQATVMNEPHYSNTRGTIAMAKLGNDPNSATSEFFINLANNAANLNFQNQGFTVFARTSAAGMVVADRIAALKIANYGVTNGALSTCPVTADPAPALFDPNNLVKFTATDDVPPLSYTVTSSHPDICSATVSATGLTVRALAPGIATITVRATDLDDLFVERSFTVTAVPGYAAWASLQNFPTPAAAAALADPDQDGICNLLEYALLSPPLTSSVTALPSAALTAAPTPAFSITFPMRTALSGTTEYCVEASTDLIIWAPIWASSFGLDGPLVSATTVIPDGIRVTIQDSTPPAPGLRRFLRLRVALSPTP